MLMQKIRNWVTGWVAGVIICLIIITFAVWGVNFSDQGAEPVVASVNGKNINLKKFQQAYNNFYAQMREYTGRPFDSNEEELLKKQVLDELIKNEVVSQAAVDNGLYISDSTIRKAVKDINVFSGENGFDHDDYKRIIMRMGMTPEIFEHQLGLDLLAQQLQSVVTDSAFVSEEEALRLTRLQKQTRSLSYMILLADTVKGSIEISDDEIEQYYDKTSEGLSQLEQSKIAYLELSIEKLTEGIEIAEENLRIYYNNNKDKYDVPEQRKVNIVDIKLSAEAESEEVLAAKNKAEKIRTLIESGISFAEISEKYDDDLEPDISVSEHDYLDKGILPKEVDDLVFAINEGELSKIEKTDEGLHIFKVSGIKGGIKNTFENSREIIEKDHKRSEAEYKYFDLADKLVTLTYEHEDSLEIAAEEIGVKVQESDFFDRNSASGLLADPKILAASFNKEAIKSGQNSEAIELNNNHLIVLQVLDYLPAEKKLLEAVTEKITRILKFKQASKLQQEKGKKILEQLKQGSDLSQVSEMFESEWEHADVVTRDDVSVNKDILRTAFKLGKPDAGGLKFSGIEINKEDYAVVVVSKVEYPDAEALLDEDIDKTKSALLQSKSSEEWSSFVDALMDEASISRNSDKL